VSSDIVAALVMKPIGGGVHLRRGTVKIGLAKWLMVGSLPSAFVGVLLLRKFGGAGDALQAHIKLSLGWALVMASVGIIARPIIGRSRTAAESPSDVPVKVLPTVLVGIFGGLIVGMTSVGSGSLMIVLLLMLYPQFRISDLVGTDLVQAIPLVASAALGHILLGDFRLSLTGSILVGAIPGVYLGARVSSRAPDGVLRPVLVLALSSSAMKLLGMTNKAFSIGVAGVATVLLIAAIPEIARIFARRAEAARARKDQVLGTVLQ
jgi:uncharacterized membrane protein YfcA